MFRPLISLLISIFQNFYNLGYIFIIPLSLWLCLAPGKYKEKKKNAKENDFLMFGCPIKNIKENQI